MKFLLGVFFVILSVLPVLGDEKTVCQRFDGGEEYCWKVQTADPLLPPFTFSLGYTGEQPTVEAGKSVSIQVGLEHITKGGYNQ